MSRGRAGGAEGSSNAAVYAGVGARHLVVLAGLTVGAGRGCENLLVIGKVENEKHRVSLNRSPPAPLIFPAAQFGQDVVPTLSPYEPAAQFVQSLSWS